MEKTKVKIEIYEGDPFKGCCGPGIASISAVEKLRRMLTERNETVKTLKEEFQGEVEIEREVVSSRKRYDMHPPHVCKLLMAGTQVPFILIDGQIVSEGRFPPLEEFRLLIRRHLSNTPQKTPGQ